VVPEAACSYSGAGDGTHVVVHAGKGAGIAYSGDHGKTWTNVTPKGLMGMKSTMVFAKGCFYLSSQGGILRSCDNGVTWEDITKGVPMMGAYAKFITQMFVEDGGFVYGFFGDQLYRFPTQ